MAYLGLVHLCGAIYGGVWFVCLWSVLQWAIDAIFHAVLDIWHLYDAAIAIAFYFVDCGAVYFAALSHPPIRKTKITLDPAKPAFALGFGQYFDTDGAHLLVHTGDLTGKLINSGL